MNYIVLGDFQDTVTKAFNNEGYRVVKASEILNISTTQDKYKSFWQENKYYEILWNNYLFGLNADVDGSCIESYLIMVCASIVEILNRNGGAVLHYDIYNKKLLDFILDNIPRSVQVILNDDGSGSITSNAPLRELLYSIPIIKYTFTKKSRVKNIISEFDAAKEIRHKWAFVPVKMGLDISMSKTGIACYCVSNDGRWEVLFGRIKTRSTPLEVERLDQIRGNTQGAVVKDKFGVEYVIDIRKSSDVCVEGGALAKVMGAFRIGVFSGLLLGVICSSGPEKRFTYVSPSELKKYTTGYGSAGKDTMIMFAKELYDIELAIDDNEADALALLRFLMNDELRTKLENKQEMRRRLKARARRRKMELRKAKH